MTRRAFLKWFSASSAIVLVPSLVVAPALEPIEVTTVLPRAYRERATVGQMVAQAWERAIGDGGWSADNHAWVEAYFTKGTVR
jgi:hypothetical protein